MFVFVCASSLQDTKRTNSYYVHKPFFEENILVTAKNILVLTLIIFVVKTCCIFRDSTIILFFSNTILLYDLLQIVEVSCVLN